MRFFTILKGVALIYVGHSFINDGARNVLQSTNFFGLIKEKE